MYCDNLQCWQLQCGHRVTPKVRCCIIGAGAAGVMAALELARKGAQVTVYEARDRIGGRCVQQFIGGVPVDMGAEFSHGNGIVMRLAEQTGIPMPRAMSDLDDCSRKVRQQLPAASSLRRNKDALWEAMDQFEEAILDDKGWAEREDCSFAQLCAERGLRADVVAGLDAKHAVEYSTSLEALGVKDWRRREFLYDEANATTDYHVQGHYFDLLQSMVTEAKALQAEFHVSHPVHSVTADTSHVKVDGEVFDYVIVTVPLNVLKQEKLRLEGVSPRFLKAVQAINCFPASKIILRLSQKVWPASHWGFAHLCPGAFAKQVWVREATAQNGEPVYVAVGFLGGPRDASLSESLTKEEAANMFVKQLREMYGAEQLEWVEALKADWSKEPWVWGAYSSPSLGCVGAWQELLVTGSARVLYAGEAAHPKGCSVDAAMESARRATQAIPLT